MRGVVGASRLGLGMGPGAAATLAISAETISLVGRMSPPPTDARIRQIDTLIATLKTNGIWAKLDCMWVLAAHNAQAARLNWIDSSATLVTVNSPTFVEDRGYQGNGASSYINSTFIPGTGKTLRDSHIMGVWVRTDALLAVGEMGAESLSVSVRYDLGSGEMFGSRSASTSVNGTTNTIGAGFGAVSRLGSTGYAQYMNTVALASVTQASSAFGGVYPLYIGGRNGSGTASYSTKQISAAVVGGGLTATEYGVLHSALRTYLAAVGAA